MRKSLIKFANCLMLSSMLLVSCHCDDDTIDIDYSLKCSSDLLELVTANASYISNSGETVPIEIHDEDWKDVENSQSTSSKVQINGETINKTGKVKEWTKHVHYDDKTSITEELIVTYSLKDNIPEDVYVNSAEYYNGLSCIVTIKTKDGDEIKQSSNTIVNPDIVVGKLLKDYIGGVKKQMKVEVKDKSTNFKSEI